MMKRRYLLLAIIAFGLVSPGAFAIDAKSRLTSMAEKLSKAKQFSVVMHMTYDSVQATGQKLEFGELNEVQLRRPNHLRVDSKKSNGEISGFISDGSVVTIFNKEDNVYAQAKSPGTIDDTVKYVVATLGVRLPLARMLVTTLPKELTSISSDIESIEINTLKSPTHHIAGRTDNVDFQVWLTNDNLPERILLTYKNEPGQPQFRSTFSNWNLDSNISDTTFTFTPPKGAEKIQLLLPEAPLVKEEAMSKVKGDNS